uniref:Uncharacterized protein n=1 Tax=Anas platyrhynchos platyrhynchos TaxID=8840 RepID=A0A493TQD6_ANAPP
GSPGPMLFPQMVLNHVLDDIELFVKQVKDALSLTSTKNQKKKKKSKGGKGEGLLPQERDPPPSQGLPSAPCLWGSSRGAEGAPPPVTQVLDNCPNHRLAPAVDAPLLIPEAVELLEKTLHPQEYSTWKMLGIAWNKTRAEYPNSEQVPPYIPTFSDGWLPPPMMNPEQQQQVRGMGGGSKDTPLPACVSPPCSEHASLSAPCTGWGHPWVLTAAPPSFRPFSPPPRLARALYEFQGRNPQELSVRMGDTLEVQTGDPQRVFSGESERDPPRVWGVGGAATLSPPALGAGPAEEVVAGAEQHGAQGLRPQQHPGAAGARGRLEPGGSPPDPPRASSTPTAPGGGVQGSPHHPLSLCPPSQVSPPNLHMGSSPAEVTAWLKDKGFSRITVRCLGVLSGHQLLQMTPEELRAVCPEEWRRVLFKLSSVKTSLGVRPPSPRTVTPPPVGAFREQGDEPRAPRSILVLPSLQMSPRD